MSLESRPISAAQGGNSLPNQDLSINSVAPVGISNSGSSIATAPGGKKDGSSGIGFLFRLPFYVIYYIVALPLKVLFAPFIYFFSLFQKTDKQIADGIMKAFNSPMNVEETKQKIKSFLALQRSDAEVLAFFEMVLNKTPHLDVVVEMMLKYRCSNDFSNKLLQMVLSKDKLGADQIVLLLLKLENYDEKNLELFKTAVLKPVFCNNVEKMGKLLEMARLKLTEDSSRSLYNIIPRPTAQKVLLERARLLHAQGASIAEGVMGLLPQKIFTPEQIVLLLKELKQNNGNNLPLFQELLKDDAFLSNKFLEEFFNCAFEKLSLREAETFFFQIADKLDKKSESAQSFIVKNLGRLIKAAKDIKEDVYERTASRIFKTAIDKKLLTVSQINLMRKKYLLDSANLRIDEKIGRIIYRNLGLGGKLLEDTIDNVLSLVRFATPQYVSRLPTYQRFAKDCTDVELTSRITSMFLTFKASDNVLSRKHEDVFAQNLEVFKTAEERASNELMSPYESYL